MTDEEADRLCENIEKAREAITARLGRWRRGDPSAAGLIDCPVCGGRETLGYRRAGSNGHVHARCLTPGCVSWME